MVLRFFSTFCGSTKRKHGTQVPAGCSVFGADIFPYLSGDQWIKHFTQLYDGHSGLATISESHVLQIGYINVSYWFLNVAYCRALF